MSIKTDKTYSEGDLKIFIKNQKQQIILMKRTMTGGVYDRHCHLMALNVTTFFTPLLILLTFPKVISNSSSVNKMNSKIPTSCNQPGYKNSSASTLFRADSLFSSSFLSYLSSQCYCFHSPGFPHYLQEKLKCFSIENTVFYNHASLHTSISFLFSWMSPFINKITNISLLFSVFSVWLC